jgi:hypothetical protein
LQGNIPFRGRTGLDFDKEVEIPIQKSMHTFLLSGPSDTEMF